MTDRTAVPERVSQRAKTSRRGGGSGSQAVGDYVGQPAGEAAQAVRRAGLRPGLDRSFGCPAELIGLVVAQDPVAGSDLARNGMVTLYVAAPGGEPSGGDVDAAPAGSGESDHGLATQEPIEEESSTPPAMPVRARRRKPGHARRATAPAESPPPPVIIEAAPAEDSSSRPVMEPLAAWPAEVDAPDGVLEHELADESRERGFTHEDFVVHVEDVLAGRSGPPGWRRAYPRRGAIRGLGNGGRLRAWLDEHRLLAGVLAVALVLWMVVGVASTLEGRRAHALHAGAVAPQSASGTKHPGSPPKPTTTQTLSAHEAQARSSGSRPATREPRLRPRRRTSVAPRHVRRSAPTVSERVAPAPRQTPAPSEAPAPPASTPTPAPEQSGGGLFSP